MRSQVYFYYCLSLNWINGFVGLIRPNLIKLDSGGKAFGKGTVAFLVFLIVYTIAISKAESIDIQGKAHAYKVIYAYDYSFLGRKRIRWAIVAKHAITVDDKAYTAIQAALDLMAEAPETHQVDIWLEYDNSLLGNGDQAAIVTDTPDGKGNSGQEENSKVWEVAVSEQNLTA